MPAVSGSPTQEMTTQPTTAALESVEVASMGDGDLALVELGDVYYVLDVESVAPRTLPGVLYTRNSNPIYTPTATASTPGRWILLTSALASGCSCPTGATGPGGGLGATGYGEFYSLTPPNTAVIASGNPVDLPNNGPFLGVTPVGAPFTNFTIAAAGVYEVAWQMTIAEGPAQLVLGLNGVEIPATLVGRATGATQLVGKTLITVTTPGSLLTLRNPAAHPGALTRVPSAGFGGVHAVSTTLTVERVA